MRACSKSLTLITSGIIALGALLLSTSSRAQTYTVHSGYDLFQTNASGTSFGGFQFQGDPLGTYQFPNPTNGQAFPSPVNVGNADTIMQRLNNVTASANGTGSTAIQLVALQLESTGTIPINVLGTIEQEHIFATLAPGIASTGNMQITFNSTGTGGTFSAQFDVYMELHLGTLTGPAIDNVFGAGSATTPILLQMTTTGTNAWSRTPPTGAEVINGVNHDLDGSDTNQDFWQTGVVEHNANGAAHHATSPAFVPEASTFLGFGGLVAFSGLCLVRKRRK